ncbi:MAG: NAD(P)-binding domain-containing protein [Nitrospira sp.]|nr:NAD(P)-binding domain-containing protein [Nitrospira sp. BO4]
MTTIGILGTGRMGVRLADAFAKAGHEVVLASRDLGRARHIAEGLGLPGIRPGTYEQAADAPFVLPAMFLRDGLVATLHAYRHQMAGKILIDITNPFNDDYSDFILPWDTSGAEELRRHFPETRLVGAFKNVWWEVFDAPTFDGTVSDVFVVGDDQDAKHAFMKIAEPMPFRFIDAGRLANARIVERMTLLSGELGQRYHYFPRMNYRFVGEPWTPGRADRHNHLIQRSQEGMTP